MFCRTATNVGEPGCESESSTGMWWKKEASFGSARIEVSLFTHLCMPPLPCFFFPLPTFLASCSCTTLLLPAHRSPFPLSPLSNRWVPRTNYRTLSRRAAGSESFAGRGVQRDHLITFSTAWLKTAHKSFVHVGLATCTCMGTCTVVNTAIVDTTLFHANTAQLNLGSYGYQYSCFPQRNCKLWFWWCAYIF